jgi:hypothetical protein
MLSHPAFHTAMSRDLLKPGPAEILKRQVLRTVPEADQHFPAPESPNVDTIRFER